MLGHRVLIEDSIIIDCCPKRVAQMARKYRIEILHDVVLDRAEYSCGLEPCLMKKGGCE